MHELPLPQGVLNNQTKCYNIDVLNYQGGDLGCSVSSARTSGLSSNQGDLGESGKGIL